MAIDRSKVIGSSDAAAICGLNPYKTAVDVWLEKTGRREPEDVSGKRAVRRGKMLEPIIRDVIAAENGIEFVNCNLRHVMMSGLPMVAEIDFEFEEDGEICNGEIKTANSRNGWGPEGSDQIPDQYMIQVMHGQIVTKRRKTLVVPAFGFDEFRYYWVGYDPELAEWIIRREAEFWKMVEEDREPDPVTLEDAYSLYQARDSGETVEANLEEIALVLRWRGLDKEIAGLEDQRDNAEMQLVSALKEKQAFTHNGKAIFTWKQQNHTHLDQQGLKAEVPELVKKYMVTKKIRVARAAGGKIWQATPESND